MKTFPGHTKRKRIRPQRSMLWRIFALAILLLVLVVFWLSMSYHELSTGERLWPWSAYALCGTSSGAVLPETVRIGLYEEFPNPWRLEKLRQVDFPVTLAIAASSREEFLSLRETIQHTYPQVREVYFWPLLTLEEGYYPGTWSNADAVERVINQTDGVPVLWDLELPLPLLRGEITLSALSVQDWWRNRQRIDRWLRQRSEPVHIWRSHRSLGLNPLFLRLIGMHFDPLEYTSVKLHLDLYATPPDEEMYRILRCGVERYGAQFIPSIGVLDDGEGPQEVFLPPAQLLRNLQLVRAAGVEEVWLFGVNGLNNTTLPIIRQTLPLEQLPTPPTK